MDYCVTSGQAVPPATPELTPPAARNGAVALNVGHLFDQMHRILKLRNDAGLANILQVSPSVISRTRRRRIRLSASLMLRLHDVSGLSIQELRALLGSTDGWFCECRQLLLDESGTRGALSGRLKP